MASPTTVSSNSSSPASMDESSSSASPQPIKPQTKTIKFISTRVLNSVYHQDWVQLDRFPCEVRQLTETSARLTLAKDLALLKKTDPKKQVRFNLTVSKQVVSPILWTKDLALIQNPHDPFQRHIVAIITKVKEDCIEFNWIAEDGTEFPGKINTKEPSELSLMERILPMRSPELFEVLKQHYGKEVIANEKKLIAFDLTRTS